MGVSFWLFISLDLEKDKPLKKRRDFGRKETTMKVLLAALLFACAYALASAFTLEQQLNYCQDKLAGAETAKVAAQNQLNTVLMHPTERTYQAFLSRRCWCGGRVAVVVVVVVAGCGNRGTFSSHSRLTTSNQLLYRFVGAALFLLLGIADTHPAELYTQPLQFIRRPELQPLNGIAGILHQMLVACYRPILQSN